MITFESVISTICLDIINVLLIDYFFSSIYDRKAKHNSYLVIIFILMTIIHFEFFFYESSLIFEIITTFIYCLMFNIDLRKSFKIAVLFLVLEVVVDFLLYYISVVIFNKSGMVRELFLDDIYAIFQFMIVKYIMYLIFHYILYKKNKLTDFKVKIFKYISLGVSIFYGITILVFYRELLFYHVSVGRIFVFTLILYNAVLVIFNYYQNMHIRTVNELDLLKQNINYQNEYLHKVVETEEKLRKLKHDMVHTYAGMHGMLVDGKYDDLKKYLEGFMKDTRDIEKVSYVGNSFVDSIICHKLSLAKEKGIDVNVICKMISIGHIDPADLGILFANALSNAIEAVEVIDNKKIEMTISTVGSYLRISIRNSVDDIRKIDFSKTSKKDDIENHGIGIKSMKHVVEKYSGTMRYEKEEHEVVLKIIMCIL